MKEFLQSFFQIPKEGTVQEKVVLSRGIMVLVNVLVILSILGITAYAFFGAYASSPIIPIKAAQFETELSLSVTDELGTTRLIDSQTNQTHTVSLEAGKTYTVTLKPSGTAQTGFCILTAAGCTQSYNTQQLGADTAVSGGKTERISFTLISTGNTVIQLDTSWGTSAFYGRVDKSDERYIYSGETVTLAIAGEQGATEPTAEPTTEPTTPVTEPTTPEPTEEPTVPAQQETVPETQATEPIQSETQETQTVQPETEPTTITE